MPSHRDYAALVARRAAIGTILLNLRALGVEALPKRGGRQKERTVFHLLLAAAFSLWRAAFLVQGVRSRADLNTHAMEFLDTLLWDNAINYPQDRRTHAWSSGYYVNNAALRLVKVGELLVLSQDEPVFARLHNFVRLQWERPGATLPDVSQGWQDCHDALLASLAALRARLSRRGAA